MSGTASPDFMAALAAQLNATTAPLGTGVAPMQMPPPPPPPAHEGGPSIAWLGKGAPFLGMPSPAGPATGDPFGLASGAPPPAPPPAAAPPAPAQPQLTTPPDPSLMPPKGIDPNAVPMPAPPQPQAPPPDVQFGRVGGGSIPEHEAHARGPTQDAHLMASFDPPMQAAGNIQLRSNMQAAAEEAAYENQARSAMARQEAAEKVQLQRQAELEARQVDYENQVTQLGQAKIDDDRWWKKKGTGDKIGAILLSFIGGLTVMDPRGNGRNLAYEALMKEADNDVEAQKFDYMVQQDQAKNAHNAYALALEKFDSEDAAAGVARAANIDYSLAKLGQMQAQWKGTDASNYADDIRARLLAERERTIATGIKFIPAQSAPGRYQMMIRGQMAPGTFSEKDAQAAFMEHQVKPAEKYDEQTLGIGGKLAEKALEQRGKHSEKADEGAKHISSQLQSAGIPQARAAAERALAAINKSPGGKGEALGRFALEKGVPIGGESVSRAVMPDDANAREQAYSDFMNAAMKATFGNVTASEEVRAARSYGTTGDPAARKRSIEAVLNTLDQMEQSAKAGASPEAQDKFDQQREKATGGKAAAPPSAKKGW